MENKQITPFKQPRSLMSVDPAAVAAGEAVKARIQAAYLMAAHVPRDVDDVRIRILQCCDNPEFAETVEYKKPIGNTKIKGLSIRFAEMALATYGNVLSEAQLLFEDDDIKRLRISALDLEGNTQFSRDISIKKTVERKFIKGREDDLISTRKNSKNEDVHLLRATEDEVLTKESAYVSKFIRTEGLRLLPADIKKEAIERSRKALANRDKGDPKAAKKRILDAFAGLNILPKDIEGLIGHGVDTMSPSEIADLRMVYAAIDSGEATWKDYTKGEKETPSAGKEKKKTAGDGQKEDDEKKIAEIKTPAAFVDIVKKQTGKVFKFVPAKDDIAHDIFSAFIEMSAEKSSMTPSELMKNASEEGTFPGFWNGFEGGTWKQHYKGKLPDAKSDAKSDAGTGTGEPGQTDSKNVFDVEWASTGVKKVGLQRFWDKNKDEWDSAPDPAKKLFKEKWIKVFTDGGVLTAAFPRDEKEPDEGGAEDGSGAENLDYGALLAEVQVKDSEGLIRACDEVGYGANLVIPMAEKARKDLYETYLSLKNIGE